MTSGRYRYYRRAMEIIDWVEGSGPDADSLAVLRQLAEDLLLTREGELDQAEHLADDVSVLLLNLTCFGDVHRQIADDLWTTLQHTGPKSLWSGLPTPPAAITGDPRPA